MTRRAIVGEFVTAKLWIKLDISGKGQIGPGKIALMEAIAETRSISAAARSMNMSYRKAWVLVDQLNAIGAASLVQTKTGGARGGGARLTAAGEQLVRDFRALQNAAEERCRSELDQLLTGLDQGEGN